MFSDAQKTISEEYLNSIRIIPWAFFSDLHNSPKYKGDRQTIGLEYERQISNKFAVSLPLSLSYKNQFIFISPSAKWYINKNSKLNAALVLSMVANAGIQSVCEQIGANEFRNLDIERTRIGPFVGATLNPNLSEHLFLSIHAGVGVFVSDNANQYYGCKDFFFEYMPQIHSSISLGYKF